MQSASDKAHSTWSGRCHSRVNQIRVLQSEPSSLHTRIAVAGGVIVSTVNTKQEAHDEIEPPTKCDPSIACRQIVLVAT